MANLLGQNIGTNYKGILNLNTLNGNLSGTLQAVTDGDGNASPLQLSTTSVNFTEQVTLTKSGGVFAVGIAGFSRFVGFTADNDSALVYNASNGLRIATVANVSMGGFSERARFDSNGNFVLGTTTASARLHVRGDGTNPIARFEDNTGSKCVGITSVGTLETSTLQAVNTSLGTNWNLGSGVGVSGLNLRPISAITATSGTSQVVNISATFNAAAGSANLRLNQIEYTINNSGAQTGNTTGIFLNATETALNGMAHNLMDLQKGGASQFRVDNSGQIYPFSVRAAATGFIQFLGRSYFDSPSDGIVTFRDNAGTSFNRLQLGGTTNAFPAIKRNSAAIDFRLADDSGFCSINASSITGLQYTVGNEGIINTTSVYGLQLISATYNVRVGASNLGAAGNASAMFQIDSTTKGFLPPRMTEAQRDLIASPATGLVIYNTTTNVLNFYNGSAWGAV
jgi:hypothetical protein